VSQGELHCPKCKSRFPIVAGVAILVDDVRGYLLGHVKGVARIVPTADIPREYLDDFLEAKAAIEVEHIEEDLEAQRVIALYLMNHYLHVKPLPARPWWKPKSGVASPLIESLICEHWDQGPFARIERWVAQLAAREPVGAVVELGCGVGGLYPALKPWIRSYLGVDSSFASIALARHVALGAPYPGEIGIPEDLLSGPVARKIELPIAKSFDGQGDFIVGELEGAPLESEAWDLALVLNAIDMVDDPASLPKLQHLLLRPGGCAIQSGPYIWHEFVARRLRAKLPPALRNDSARAVEWLYGQAGFSIAERADHVPWLFFKHVRQLEIYSVHLLRATKAGPI
jgi:SAM-dependent methyltransferase